MAENQKMEIDLGEDVAQGNYINLAIIAHSVSEFIIDFATVLPGVPKAKVKSRVILTPEHAKRLLLSYPTSVDYTSCMVDICIPESMKDVELVLKSSGGSTWSEGAFLTLFDCVKQTPLLSTTLSQPEEMVLAFPSRGVWSV